MRPPSYDPTWTQLTILNAGETGRFVVAQQLPAGGEPLGRGTFYDYDGDSFVDLFLAVDVNSPLVPIVVRGTQDGFARSTSPAPRTFSDFLGPIAHLSLDADPEPELMTSDRRGQFYVVHLGGNRPPLAFDPWALGFGDIIADGIDDYIRVNVGV